MLLAYVNTDRLSRKRSLRTGGERAARSPLSMLAVTLAVLLLFACSAPLLASPNKGEAQMAETGGYTRDQLWKPLHNNFFSPTAAGLFEDNRQIHITWLAFPPFSVPEDPLWNENPYGNTTWLFYYHSLGWLYAQSYAFDTSGDQSKLETAFAIIEDWIADNPRAAPASAMAWYDHSVAYRGAVLAYFVNEYGTYMSAELHAAIVDSIHEHADALLELFLMPQFDVNNHGMYHALSLYNLSYVFDSEPEAPGWRADASARFFEVLGGLVDTTEFVSTEQASAYQYNVIQLIHGGVVLFQGYGDPDADDVVGVLRGMLEFAAQLTYPDDTLPAYGDSNFGLSRTYQLASLAAQPGLGSDIVDYVLSHGTTGQQPDDMIIKPESGYLLLRPHWTPGPDWSNDVMVFMDFSPARISHGHHDSMNFTYYNDGAEIFVDPGGPYSGNLFDVQQFRRVAAHNLVLIDDRQELSGRAELVKFENSLLYSAIELRHQIGGVGYSRTLILDKQSEALLVLDRLESFDRRPHTYALHHHLAPGTAISLTEDGYTATLPNGSGVDVQLETRSPASLEIVEGRETPDLQGWVTPIYGLREPAPVVIATLEGGGTQWYRSVIVPHQTPERVRRTGIMNLRKAERAFGVKRRH